MFFHLLYEPVIKTFLLAPNGQVNVTGTVNKLSLFSVVKKSEIGCKTIFASDKGLSLI